MRSNKKKPILIQPLNTFQNIFKMQLTNFSYILFFTTKIIVLFCNRIYLIFWYCNTTITCFLTFTYTSYRFLDCTFWDWFGILYCVVLFTARLFHVLICYSIILFFITYYWWLLFITIDYNPTDRDTNGEKLFVLARWSTINRSCRLYYAELIKSWGHIRIINLIFEDVKIEVKM